MITIISGSQRSDSQTLKVAKYISTQLNKRSIETNIIDLSDHSLPRYDNDHNTKTTPDIWKMYSDTLRGSQGFVIISPERGGMVPGELKNFLLRSKDGEMAHKPAMIVSISSGTGGAYPIAELRMSSYKNTKICYIPDHIIVRDVDNVLNDEDNNEEANTRIISRINKTLDVFEVYIHAFAYMQTQKATTQDQIPYGM